MIRELQTVEIEHYQYVSEVSALNIIKDEGVNIAICQRPEVDGAGQFIKLLAESNFSSFNMALNIVDFPDLFDEHFKVYQSVTHGYHLLKNDINQLIALFGEICESNSVKVFFGKVETDMCKRFHVDMYELRMLCTYTGFGTHWLTNDNINYQALDNFKLDDDIALREYDIRKLEPKDVAIIKGALSASQVGALVHKSPAIEQLRQKRILLRVDCNSLSDHLQ